MPRPTQKRTISQIDQEQRRLEAEREADLSHTARKKRVQGQIPMPHGRPDRSNGGYSLAKEMQIDKHMMTLLRLQESVRTTVRTHLGKAFLDGETRYNKIGFQRLGAIAIDVMKEFPWLERDYEDVWPLDPLIRTTIENRKTVLRRRKRGGKYGESVKVMQLIQHVGCEMHLIMVLQRTPTGPSHTDLLSTTCPVPVKGVVMMMDAVGRWDVCKGRRQGFRLW
ncbi:uncharacterized protein EI90DRAFT_3010714 [Cantharellus anzutake]|uniref:uncharacterized protein n=1 Tax=Cantharellus anzutake TaxID=1750568 RepID=UPI001905979C|nr:uncharacterized protein EI90DRAFT_3010714 [Cantharellus anzutake]KAF8343841.1 hypothetical protein EI90DRAFT_3010714 [Cantharellus anzutake]